MAKAIMVQGTTSNSGKSFITAALCRIFARMGYKTAPFKSQNMALNSFITKDGLEMGRAQVMQAQAAGIDPKVEMNPILLKPSSDSGSQIIVNGTSIGNMTAAQYYAYKPALIPQIMQAYNTLCAQYDVIVIEGAGSPAEINLKENDIVNMGMAKLAQAPVLLVGDIDRGGVFAALAGTMLLLDPLEKSMVKGLIINKFRGDKNILAPGLDMLYPYTNTPVLGVVPMLQVDIDDEDSLSQRFDQKQVGAIDIVVPRLPRISNFTDFAPLERIPGLSLRYITNPGQLGAPDLIILPGTKNTMEDLLWLRENGLEAAILQQAARGVAVLGICGGYQMLGQSLSDPHSVEHGGNLAGMGLLPTQTVFQPQKTRTQVAGCFGALAGPLAALSGAALQGYEIHMGQTHSTLPPATRLHTIDGTAKTDGAFAGNVYGSYVHGLFDAPAATTALVTALCQNKGIAPLSLSTLSLESYQQQQYDKLADGVAAALDMQAIQRILQEGL